MDMTKQSHDVAVYGGYIDNDNKLMQSASGGIATALAEQMIEAGGYVAGVSYSEDFHKAEYIIVKDKHGLEKLKGSKYIETDKKDVYVRVKSLLARGDKVLFIGLPCTVAALYRFLGERTENLLTCELICHGPTSTKVHEEYVSYLEKKYNSKIIGFSVRHKKMNGCQHIYMRNLQMDRNLKSLFIRPHMASRFLFWGGSHVIAANLEETSVAVI